MQIVYRECYDFEKNELYELFSSVEWLSAKYFDRMVKALKKSDTVFAVWDGDNLIAMINVIGDGELTAYVHYLLVHPDYQRKGIGSKLIEMVKDRYKNFLYIIIIAAGKELIDFYGKHSFSAVGSHTPMVIMNDDRIDV